MKNPDRSDGISRRRLLKQSSAIAGMGGLASFSQSAVASAVSKVPDVDWLHGRKAKAVIRRLTDTDEFARLSERAAADGGTVITAPRNDHVARATLGDDALEIGYFEIVGVGADEAYITIGLDPDSGEVTTAGLEYDTRAKPTEISGVQAQSTDPDPIRSEIFAIDATDGMAEETIRVEETPVAEIVGADSGQEIGTQLHNAWCVACQAAVDGLCTYGCGLPGWFLCGLIGLGTAAFGGLGCLAFVTAACGVISIIGCQVTHASQRICAHPEIDLCEPP